MWWLMRKTTYLLMLDSLTGFPGNTHEVLSAWGQPAPAGLTWSGLGEPVPPPGAAANPGDARR